MKWKLKYENWNICKSYGILCYCRVNYLDFMIHVWEKTSNFWYSISSILIRMNALYRMMHLLGYQSRVRICLSITNKFVFNDLPIYYLYVSAHKVNTTWHIDSTSKPKTNRRSSRQWLTYYFGIDLFIFRDLILHKGQNIKRSLIFKLCTLMSFL